MNHLNSSFLDRYRHKNGTYKLKAVVKEMGKKDKNRLLYYINDKKLSFGSLFILIPEIDALDLYKQLSIRNITALKIFAKVTEDKELEEKAGLDTSETKDNMYPAMKWMIDTGYYDDGLNDKFDEVLDAAASQLIKTYQDKTVLPAVAEMIFKRNRKGRFTHDLIWAFFESRDPYTLEIIARYLRSSNKKDVELASDLLRCNLSEEGIHLMQPKSYSSYHSWLKENFSFIYFSGESFQQTSHPSPWKVDLSRKYLCQDLRTQNKKLTRPLAAEELNDRLEHFKQLKDEDKILLSQYSYKMHKKNIRLWDKWMKYPLSKQLEMAKKGLGGDIE